MLRLKNLRNKFQKRTLRVLYGQTQAYPYATELYSALRDANGAIAPPTTSTTDPFTYTADTFTLNNSIVPGTVMVLAEPGSGESVAVADGADTAAQRHFGLLANFLGGDFDEIGDENEVGVWKGVGSVYEVLAPAFDDSDLANCIATTGAAGRPIELTAGTDGRLTADPDGNANGLNDLGTNRQVVAELIERVDANRIIIELKV